MASETSVKGSLVEADAISYYTKAGYIVSIPFTPTDYDLLIERDGKISRIQCKKAHMDSRGRCVVSFRLSSSSGKRIVHDYAKFDFLYCLSPSGARYVMPSCDILGRFVALYPRYIQPSIEQECTKMPDPLKRCGRCGKALEDNYQYKCCDRCRRNAAESNRKRRAKNEEG